jgi:hypothetical protein
MKPFVENLSCDVLKRSIVVICGEWAKTWPLYDRMASKYMSKKTRQEIWAGICEEWDKACRESPGCRAITAVEHGDAYIVIPEWRLSVFSHEAYHAVQAVLREVGTSDEELGAYLTEWIFRTIIPVVQNAGKEK